MEAIPSGEAIVFINFMVFKVNLSQVANIYIRHVRRSSILRSRYIYIIFAIIPIIGEL